MSTSLKTTLQSFGLRSLLVITLIVVAGYCSFAQDVTPVDKNLEVRGVPPIPASLAAEVAPYSQMYGLPLAGWDPVKRRFG